MSSKLLYLLPCLLLFLTACPSETKEEDPTPEEGCLLATQQVETFGQWPKKPAALYRYSYNSQNQLSSITMDSVYSGGNMRAYAYNMHYNANKQLERIDIDQTLFGQKSRIDYEYNNLQQLIKLTRHLQNETGMWYLQDYYDYIYSSGGELQQARYHELETGIYKLRYILSYTYNKGNPVQVVKHTQTGQELANITYTYDDKPAALPLLPLEFSQPEDFMPARNNIQSATWSASFGTRNNYTVQYTYNTEGYPVSGTRTYSLGKTEISSTYTCAK